MTLKYSWHQVSRFSYIIRQVLSLKKMFVPLKKGNSILFLLFFPTIYILHIHT